MPTPPGLPVPKRDIHFDLDRVDLDAWHPAGYHASHYFNVHSLLFPQGERFFIRSVRHFRDQVTDPVLQAQVAGFIGQEAMHGREHEAYNAALARIGYRVDVIDRLLERVWALTERVVSPKGKLAMTVALEHITAIGSEVMLSDPRVLAGAHPEMARLWHWHALEETEHKAVAFDVYRQVAGDGFMAWFRRCTALLVLGLEMQLTVWAVLLRISIRSGQWKSLSGWGRLLHYLWIRPGIFRRQVPGYFAFFRPGFHPWDIDNSKDVQRWAAQYREATPPPATRRSGALRPAPGGR